MSSLELNLNEFLLSVSHVLDFVEMDILGVTSNHSKRVAYISLHLAKEIGLRSEECFDIVALSILHDNGVSERVFHSNLEGDYGKKLKSLEGFKEHCDIGEKNIKEFPFLGDVSNIIKYHHERYDGRGYFSIKGEDIPIMAQIIALGDTIDLKFNLKKNYKDKEKGVLEYLELQTDKLVSSQIKDAFLSVNKKINFDIDLRDEFIDEAIKNSIPSFKNKLAYEELKNITEIFSKVIDSKSKFTARHSSGLSSKVCKMAEYYKKCNREKQKLVMAAGLHDIGKLTVPNMILDKPGKMNEEEFKIMKGHPYYTRKCLEKLKGFEDITEWASNHHEKLNGSGYPKGLKERDLDFNSRLMACLDIYQALTEERPYRQSLSHEKSIEILFKMAEENLIDKNITKDIDFVFGNNRVKAIKL